MTIEAGILYPVSIFCRGCKLEIALFGVQSAILLLPPSNPMSFYKKFLYCAGNGRNTSYTPNESWKSPLFESGVKIEEEWGESNYLNINVTKSQQSESKNRVLTQFTQFFKHHIANLTPEIDFLDNFTLVNCFSGSYWSKNNGMRATFWKQLSPAKMLVLALEKRMSEWLALQYTALRQRERDFHGHFRLVGIVFDLGKWFLAWFTM